MKPATYAALSLARLKHEQAVQDVKAARENLTAAQKELYQARLAAWVDFLREAPAGTELKTPKYIDMGRRGLFQGGDIVTLLEMKRKKVWVKDKRGQVWTWNPSRLTLPNGRWEND